MKSLREYIEHLEIRSNEEWDSTYNSLLSKANEEDLSYLIYLANLDTHLGLWCVGYLSYHGYLLPQDINMAFRCFSRLSTPESNYYLGLIYIQHYQEYEVGAYYLERSNLPKAQEQLGHVYRFGFMGEIDYARAYKLYQQSNTPDAIFAIGEMYEFGLGFGRDLNKAKYYYRASGTAHAEYAMELLSRNYK